MTGLGDLRLSRNDLRAILLSGEIRDVIGKASAVNCSRCGRRYSEHAHSLAEAGILRGKGRTEGLHAFRTQNDVGLWLTGRRFDGLIYEPDGKWDDRLPLGAALRKASMEGNQSTLRAINEAL